MKRGFTLIELVMVIIILGILAAVAIPAFVNLSGQARISACQASLGGLRSGVAIWYARSATGGTPAYPALADFTNTTSTTPVMQNFSIPANPFYAADTTNPKTIIAATATAHYTTTGGGWMYSSSNGDIWGNTADSSTY